MSDNDVVFGISEKANHLLQVALRRSSRNRQPAEQALMASILQVGYMLGLEAQAVEQKLNVQEVVLNKDVAIQHRFTQLVVQLAKLHNEMAHMQLPRLDELGLSLGQALHRTFHLYARKQIGQGRFQYDVDNPRLNDSQLMKMCQDAGLVEPQGILPTANLHVIMAAHKPPGSSVMRCDFKTFLRLMASVASETLLDVYVPVAALGLQTRPRPILKTLLLTLDLNRHWNLPSSTQPITDETLRRLQSLPWEEPSGAGAGKQDAVPDQHMSTRSSADARGGGGSDEVVPAGTLAQLLARVDELQAQVARVSAAKQPPQQPKEEESIVFETPVHAAKGAKGVDESQYRELKAVVDQLQERDAERAKVWRVEVERQGAEMHKFKQQMGALERRVKVLEEGLEEHRDAVDVALENVQERLSGIARKLNQLSQEKLNVAVFSDLQATLATLERDKVSNEGRLKYLESELQIVRVGGSVPASGVNAPSSGSGHLAPQRSSTTLASAPSGQLVSTSLDLPAPVKSLAEQLAILQAEFTGTKALHDEAARAMTESVAALKSEVAQDRGASREAISALEKRVDALQGTLNDTLGDGGELQKGTAQLREELQQQEAKQMATELAFHHIMTQIADLQQHVQSGDAQVDEAREGDGDNRGSGRGDERNSSSGAGKGSKSGSPVRGVSNSGGAVVRPRTAALLGRKSQVIPGGSAAAELEQLLKVDTSRVAAQAAVAAVFDDAVNAQEQQQHGEQSRKASRGGMVGGPIKEERGWGEDEVAEEDEDAEEVEDEEEFDEEEAGGDGEGADGGRRKGRGRKKDRRNSEDERLFDMIGMTAEQLARQQAADELAAELRLATLLPKGESEHSSDWDDSDLDDLDEESAAPPQPQYQTLEPVQRSRRVLQPPAGGAAAPASDPAQDAQAAEPSSQAKAAAAAVQPHAEEDPPLPPRVSMHPATLESRAPTAAAQEEEDGGANAQPGEPGQPQQPGQRSEAIKKTLHQVMNDFARQVGADIKLDQLTSAELAAAERLAAKLLGEKAPESLAASARKAVLEAGAESDVATSFGNELVAVALTAPSEAEAMAAARLAASVLGLDSSLAQAAAAGAASSQARSAARTKRRASVLVVPAEHSPDGAEGSKADEGGEVDELEKAAADARQALLAFGTGSHEAIVAVQELASRVRSAADAAGGELPAPVQRMLQMALAGYPEDSEAARRGAQHLAEHILSGRISRRRAGELKDMVSLIYGEASPEALVAAAVTRLPEGALAAGDAAGTAKHLPAVVARHGAQSTEVAVVEAQVAVLSHGVDSPDATTAVRRAMFVAASTHVSAPNSRGQTPTKRSFKFGRKAKKAMLLDTVRAGAAPDGSHAQQRRADGEEGDEEDDVYEDEGGAYDSPEQRSSLHGAAPLRQGAGTTRRSIDEERVGTAAAARQGGSPDHGRIRPALKQLRAAGQSGSNSGAVSFKEQPRVTLRDDDAGGAAEDRRSHNRGDKTARGGAGGDGADGRQACLGAQVLVPRLTTVRPRSVRTFHMEEDGLGTIPADVMVKLPSEVQQLAHAVNALVDNMREVNRKDAAGGGQGNQNARMATVYQLSMAVADQAQSTSQQAAKLTLLEAAVLKVAKQLDTVMHELHNITADKLQPPVQAPVYAAYPNRNRFGGPAAPMWHPPSSSNRFLNVSYGSGGPMFDGAYDGERTSAPVRGMMMMEQQDMYYQQHPQHPPPPQQHHHYQPAPQQQQAWPPGPETSPLGSTQGSRITSATGHLLRPAAADARSESPAAFALAPAPFNSPQSAGPGTQQQHPQGYGPPSSTAVPTLGPAPHSQQGAPGSSSSLPRLVPSQPPPYAPIILGQPQPSPPPPEDGDWAAVGRPTRPASRAGGGGAAPVPPGAVGDGRSPRTFALQRQVMMTTSGISGAAAAAAVAGASSPLMTSSGPLPAGMDDGGVPTEVLDDLPESAAAMVKSGSVRGSPAGSGHVAQAAWGEPAEPPSTGQPLRPTSAQRMRRMSGSGGVAPGQGGLVAGGIMALGGAGYVVGGAAGTGMGSPGGLRRSMPGGGGAAPAPGGAAVGGKLAGGAGAGVAAVAAATGPGWVAGPLTQAAPVAPVAPAAPSIVAVPSLYGASAAAAPQAKPQGRLRKL